MRVGVSRIPRPKRRYRSVDTVVTREIVGGRLARRWDIDVDPVVLNDTAWRLLETIAAAGGVTHEDILSAVSTSTVGDQTAEVEVEAALEHLLRAGLLKSHT